MVNSPSIVLASLSDDKLKESINSLVKHVNEKMEEMVESTNSAVKRMEDKLTSLGKLKIDSGGSSDGGTGRRTQQHEKLTKAVNDASEAVSKETQKLQDLQQSLSGASDREQNFISQKERAANTISKENELLQRQEQELANLKNQQQQLANEKTGFEKQRQDAIALRKAVADLSFTKAEFSLFSAINQYGKMYGHKNPFSKNGLFETGDAAFLDVFASKLKTTTEEAEKMLLTLQHSKQSLKLFKDVHWEGNMGLSNTIVEIDPSKVGTLKVYNETLKGVKSQLDENSESSQKLATAEEKLGIATAELLIMQRQEKENSQQKAQVDAQVAAKEKEIAETKGRIAAATREQTEAEKNASQAAKEKSNIQSQVANQEKQVAEAKKQLTTATQQQAEVEKQSVQNVVQQTAASDRQIKKNQEVAMTFDQIATALSQARRTVSDFNTKLASGMQPSSKDYKKYEQALARIVEFNDKLKQSALAMADANQKAFAFDGKYMVKDAFNVDERLKELNRWYSSMEKKPELIPQEYAFEIKNIENKLSSLKSRLQNAKDEFAQLGKRVEDESRAFIVARDRIIQYKQAIREHNATIQLYEYQVARGREVDAFDKYEYDKAKEKVKELKEELQKLWNERFDIPAPSKADIDRYNELKHKITEIQKEVEKYENSLRSINGQQQTTQSAQQQESTVKNIVASERDLVEEEKQRLALTREIAEEAREAMARNGASAYLTPYRSESGAAYIYAENDARAKGLTIEQQIANILRENDSLYQASARSASMVVEEEKKITQEQDKRKTYKAPVTTINDSFKQLTANALGVNPSEIDSTSTRIAKMTTYVRQLETAYSNLTRTERESPFGMQLRQQIQQISRDIQMARSEISRPINLKDAFSYSESTLDDIAHKMHRLASYRSGLDVNTQKSEIDQVNRKYTELQKKMNEVMAKNSQMISSNNILASSWKYMRNRLAFYLTVSTGTTLIRDLARVRSEYEMNEKALGTLLNSAERGTRIFNELSNMALVSPYTLIELSAAAKQLAAYDIAAKDVVDTTRRLADISAAVGIPVERLTYALGQVKAYGHLTSQDARQFLNAGVPLVKELANRYSELEGRLVSTADVYDRMKKHAISYNDVLSVLTSMTDEGGKFFDYQAKMAETLKVRLANLTLAYNNMLNEMGKANGGAFTTGIKGLTALLKHWREIERILGTVVVAVGAYRAATLLAGITTTTSIGKNAFGAWISLARGVKSAKDATALFSLTIKSIPFVGWATAIASLVSYFVLFNNSADETKQKLQDIATAFEGIRKEATDLFADAISTDSLGTQLTKLKDMLELAETELGITIPIKLEDVNESNIKQKLREAKNTIDNYVNFSQSFSEAAVGTRFNESMTDFGTTARSVYTSVTESVNSVKVALQELVDAGRASKRDIEILKELDNKPKDGESRIEYFQRLVKLYEELGLIGKKETVIPVGGTQPIDNMIALQSKQEASLDRLAIKNKTVFKTMLSDVQDYYDKSNIAAYQLEQQVERFAKRINLEKIPKEERTAKLEVAINQEAAKNNWNEFAIQYAKWVANQKYGLNITISEESKKNSEIELSDWQKRMQAWADKNGIKFSLNFIEEEDEKSYADRMLQAAKDAKAKLDVQRRKLAVGTGSQAAVDAAKKAYNDARKLAKNAGADLEQLDKKANAAAKKAAKAAESELAKALKDELSTIDKVRSIYKDLTKEGMSHADAVERATEGWDETVNAINKVLQKNGLKKLDLTKFAGITNPRELVDMLQSQLDILVKRGAKAEEIKELQTKIRTLNVDAEKYDLTRITKGLNSELDKLKEEYELAVELDANPEFGSVFADMFGINMETLPRTAKEYAERATKELNKYLSDKKSKIKIGNLLSLTNDDLRMFQERVETDGLSQEWVDNIIKAAKDVRDAWKKETSDTIKNWNSLVEKYGEIQAKITKINKDSSAQIKDIVMQYGSDKQKSLATRLYDNLSKEQNPVEIEKLRKQIEDIVSEISEKYPIALKILVAIGNANKRQISQALWEDFKNGDLYTSTFEDMERVSTFTIKRILDELERLKNKVKDDPASMKALMKSMDDARNKLQERNPFKTLSESIEKLKKKRIDVKKAKESLDNAKKALDDANRKGNEEESVKNIKKVEEAEKVLSQTSDELTASLQELKKAQEGVSAAMQSLAGIISTTSDITKALGGSDDSVETLNDLAESINGVTEAAEGITDIVTGAESGNILTIIQGAQKTIEGTWKTIDTWLDNSDKRRTRSIERSQMAIKHLELAYIDLQHAVDKAYGMATIGAQKAAIANKELQLVELKRQLALEQGRKKKYRDNARIVELQQQIKELQYEIQDATDSIVNDLLGISSVGDAMENLMDGLIDALRSGEDAMAVFDENIDNMIANMIKKMYVTKVLQPWFENVWEQIQMDINKRGGDAAKLAQEQLSLDDNQLRTQMANQRVFDFFEKSRREGYTGYFPAFRTMQNFFAKGITDEDLKAFRKDAQRRLTEATSPTMEDLMNYAELLREGRPVIENGITGLNEALKQLGIDKESLELSSLQQGISQITENTAGAIESYLNGVSQQVYYHSSLLEQIRDSVVGLDLDVSLGVQSQMLLQLQNSYQTQQAIQQILEGVLVPSGRAFAVELIS